MVAILRRDRILSPPVPVPEVVGCRKHQFVKEKPIPQMLWLYLHALFFLLQFQAGFSVNNHTRTKNPLCRQDQRQLLLQLKQQFHYDEFDYIHADACDQYRPDDYYKTENWNQSPDCCLWDGVACDDSTGFVTGLDLSCGRLSGNLNPNSSLFRLAHLRNLNLAYNNFTGSQIPSEFGWINTLKHLNLSNSGFGGRIPPEFYYLSGLVSLDISTGYTWYSYARAPDLECDVKLLLTNMTKMRKLSLRRVGASSEIPVNMSYFLTHLDLGMTELPGKLPATIFERPYLEVLWLDHNDGLTGSLPSSLNRSKVESIKTLDLSSTSLSGIVPERLVEFMDELELIDISNCRFSGVIPESIGNLTMATEIDFSGNEFSGQIPSTLSNLRQLMFLDLSNNFLQGQIPSTLFHLQKLAVLQLKNNSLVGRIPPSLTNMSGLHSLDLSSNALTGTFPSRAGHGLQKLHFMDLSHNSIQEYQPSQHLESLGTLYLHFNALQGPFPSSICNLTHLSVLNLSNNKLKGEIPECIGNTSTQYLVLDLSSNEFDGTIPTFHDGECSLQSIRLNGNHLEGPLPGSFGNCTGLEVLDVGNNLISGSFPSWLRNHLDLKILILKSNRFHGSIEPSLTNDSFSQLRILDLSHNNFTGHLPEELFSRLEVMKNEDEASMYGLFTEGYAITYQYSTTVVVKGTDQEFSKKVQRILTTIDLSSNDFQGGIPESLSHLTSLRLLNLSHNSIGGRIPPALGRMTNLEQLDLSSNQLTGGIPEALTNLTFLAALNLSHNHLVGRIPQGNQFSTFPRDSYVGNSGLSGAPLTRAAPSPTAFQEGEEDDDSSFVTGFTWQAVVMGYGCGIAIGFILGSGFICLEKPDWFARFYNTQVANCLHRRKRRIQGRR